MSETYPANPNNAEQDPNVRVHVDLQSDDYDQQFAEAQLFVKTAPVVVDQITAEGLTSGAYADKGVYQNEEGQFILETIVVNQHFDEQGSVVRVPEIENTTVLEPGFFIVTNPVWQDGEPRNHFVQKSAEKIDALYEPASEADVVEGYSFGDGDLPGAVMRPRGYGEGEITPREVVQNQTGHPVEIDAPWGGTQDGNFDCYFAQDGTKDNRYILSQNDFAGYVSYDQYKQQ